MVALDMAETLPMSPTKALEISYSTEAPKERFLVVQG
jgi:hypothetical protein